jgi:hypothetical protein
MSLFSFFLTAILWSTAWRPPESLVRRNSKALQGAGTSWESATGQTVMNLLLPAALRKLRL